MHAPPSIPVLGDREVHLWIVDLGEKVGEIEGWRKLLSREEAARADRFKFPKDCRDFTVGRGCLRLFLAGYLNTTPAEIALGETDLGKPTLAGASRSTGLEFNLSRRAGHAIYGFTRGRRIGVDLERIRPEIEALSLVEKYFSKSERIEFLRMNESARQAAFFRTWTRKEAFAKAHGLGLSEGLDWFSVSVREDESPALTECRNEPQAPSQWYFADVPGLDQDYVGAVAVEGQGLELRWFTYSA